MKKALQDQGFDNLDRAILDELQTNGRVSVADLARKIHLSQPAVHNRIKRLERRGVIRGYVALVDREQVGYDVMCFVQLSIQQEHINTIREAVGQMPQVLECYRMTGESDMLLKVVVGNHRQLNEFIEHTLCVLPGIQRVETAVVLSEMKATTQISLD
ncbi:MAG: Lrp/AsnC family transcriptional regulator [Anaerolineaceae bacterium]|nr:MAG: Lrp/AsnC family transcriptional regulator [Anaerolineaceae bacterium]